MLKELIGLRLHLTANLFRPRTAQKSETVIRILLTLVGFVAVSLAIAITWSLEPVSIYGGFSIVHPAIAFGGMTLVVLLIHSLIREDDELDARYFTGFRFSLSKLFFSLPIAGLFTIPMFMVFALALGLIIAQVQSYTGAAMATLSLLIILLIATLQIRVASAISSLYFRSVLLRRTLQVVWVGIAVTLIVAFQIWRSGLHPNQAKTEIIQFIDWFATLPFATSWNWVSLAERGDWASIGENALPVIVYLILLGLLWLVLLDNLRFSPVKPTLRTDQKTLGWFAALPANALGAIAGRSLVYWFSDPRYWVQLLFVPLIPVLIILPLALVQVPASYLFLIPIPIMSVFIGWMLHNDIALDDTAFWMPLSAGSSAISDRIGRTLPAILLWAPLLIIGSVVVALLAKDWFYLASSIGTSTAAWAGGLGLSSVASVRRAYPTTKPRQSPFWQPVTLSGAGSATQAMLLAGTILLALPSAALSWYAVAFKTEAFHLYALLIGLVIGALSYTVGIRTGARWLRRMAPELLSLAQHS